MITTALASKGGIFSSRIFDAGVQVDWKQLLWEQEKVADTVTAFSIRSGNTASPDNSWTPYVPVKNLGDLLNGRSRYIQYRIILANAVNVHYHICKDILKVKLISNDH